MHEGGFDCIKTPVGGIEFRDPGGRRIDRTGQILGLCPSLDITERMRDRYEDLYIDANTCVSNYTSGGIDWNMAVSGLMN